MRIHRYFLLFPTLKVSTISKYRIIPEMLVYFLRLTLKNKCFQIYLTASLFQDKPKASKI